MFRHLFTRQTLAVGGFSEKIDAHCWDLSALFHTLKNDKLDRVGGGDKYDRVGLWHSGAMKWTQFPQFPQGRAYDKYEKYDRVELASVTPVTRESPSQMC